MNKTELIAAIATRADLTKVAAAAALDAFVDITQEAVADCDTVSIVGFGTFKGTKRAARTGRNPATGATLKIAASVSPKFTAGAKFKAAVNPVKGGKKK